MATTNHIERREPDCPSFRWLRQYLEPENGIPSHDTFGRVFAALEGCIVTIDAMGTQPNIAQAIRDRGANYILSVKDNQLKLADSVQDFFVAFQAAPDKTLHQFDEVVFGDDQMRARTGHAAHNFAVLRHIALNVIRLAPVKRNGGIKVRRLIAATSDNYRAQLLGLV